MAGAPELGCLLENRHTSPVGQQAGEEQLPCHEL